MRHVNPTNVTFRDFKFTASYYRFTSRGFWLKKIQSPCLFELISLRETVFNDFSNLKSFFASLFFFFFSKASRADERKRKVTNKTKHEKPSFNVDVIKSNMLNGMRPREKLMLQWREAHREKGEKKAIRQRWKNLKPQKQFKCRLSKGDSSYYGETSSVLRCLSLKLFFSSSFLFCFISSIHPRKPSHEEHYTTHCFMKRDFNLYKSEPEAIPSSDKYDLNCWRKMGKKWKILSKKDSSSHVPSFWAFVSLLSRFHFSYFCFFVFFIRAEIRWTNNVEISFLLNFYFSLNSIWAQGNELLISVMKISNTEEAAKCEKLLEWWKLWKALRLKFWWMIFNKRSKVCKFPGWILITFIIIVVVGGWH